MMCLIFLKTNLTAIIQAIPLNKGDKGCSEILFAYTVINHIKYIEGNNNGSAFQP